MSGVASEVAVVMVHVGVFITPLVTQRLPRYPLLYHPHPQNEAQTRLHVGSFFGPSFWDGGGRDERILEFHM